MTDFYLASLFETACGIICSSKNTLKELLSLVFIKVTNGVIDIKSYGNGLEYFFRFITCNAF